MSRLNGKSPSGEEDRPNPDREAPPPETGKKPRAKRKNGSSKTQPADPKNQTDGTPIGSIAPGGWPAWIVPVPALLGIALILSLAWLGTRNPAFGPKVIPLQQIQISLPTWLNRVQFLDEVRYLSSLPTTVDPSLEEDLFHLKAGLGKHPWVRSVDALDFQNGSLTAKVQFRTPVLEVGVDPDKTTRGNTRFVDEAGVLLPVGDFPGLTRLGNFVPAPRGEPGQLWGDPVVEGGAALVGWLTRQTPPLRPAALEGVPGAWRLQIQGHPVFWGSGTDGPSRLAFLRLALESVGQNLPIDVSGK